MTSSTPARSHLLTFLLPAAARHDLARATPDVFGCLYEIGRALGLVSIYGCSKEAVFAQAAQVLGRACPSDQRHSIAANLYINRHVDPLDERRDWLLIGGGVDSWTIVVMGGEAAFCPTALGAEFPVIEDTAVAVAAPAAIRS